MGQNERARMEVGDFMVYLSNKMGVLVQLKGGDSQGFGLALEGGGLWPVGWGMLSHLGGEGGGKFTSSKGRSYTLSTQFMRGRGETMNAKR